MKVGDLLKVGFAEGDYYGILLGFYPYNHEDIGRSCKVGDYKILFCDGEVVMYSQSSLDFDEVTMEVISPGSSIG